MPCFLFMWHAQEVWGRRSLVNLLRWRKRVVPLKPVTSCGDVYRLTNSSHFWILSQRQTQQQQEERPFSQVSGNTGNKHMGCWETASYGNSEVRIYRLLIVHAGYFQNAWVEVHLLYCSEWGWVVLMHKHLQHEQLNIKKSFWR